MLFRSFEIEDMSLNHTSVTLDLDLPALLALQSGLIPVLGQDVYKRQFLRCAPRFKGGQYCG